MREGDKLSAFPSESPRAINSNRCAVNGQEESPLARRRYQRGHVFQKRTKRGSTWWGRYREDVVLPDGTRRRIKRAVELGEYATKRLALRALESRLAVVNSLTYRSQPIATFAQFADRWEANVISQLKPSTACNYRLHIRKHLKPYFGKLQVRDIGPEVVQIFVAEQSRLHRSPKTVRNIIITFRAMWRSARSWGYVAHDVFEGIVLPELNPTHRYFFAAEDVWRVISAAQEPYRTFYGLLAETGLRVGELCGITLDDIDLGRSFLIVRRSAWRGKLGSPKTPRSFRIVDLSSACVANLAGYLESRRPNERRLLFATRNGTPWDQNLLLKRHFRPLLRKLGIDVPRGNGFHAFRHANETLMDRFGVPLKVRQDRLGHVDSRMTLGVYTHSVSADAKLAATKLGSVVWGSNEEILASERPPKEKWLSEETR